MPGCTFTVAFGLAPCAVTRVAAVPGVITHAACTIIPGWTCTTALGGNRVVGGSGVLTRHPLALAGQTVMSCPARGPSYHWLPDHVFPVSYQSATGPCSPQSGKYMVENQLPWEIMSVGLPCDPVLPP